MDATLGGAAEGTAPLGSILQSPQHNTMYQQPDSAFMMVPQQYPNSMTPEEVAAAGGLTYQQ